MPQCHNRERQHNHDSTAFGKNSRFASVVDNCGARERALEVRYHRQMKQDAYYSNMLKRRANAELNRIDRIQSKLCSDLTNISAYKLVLEDHRYRDIYSVDKKRAMQINYTIDGLRVHIKDMLKKMKPQYIRMQKAQLRIDEARGEYEAVITRNLRTIPTARTRVRRELRQKLKDANAELQLSHTDDEAAFVLTPSPIPDLTNDGIVSPAPSLKKNVIPRLSLPALSHRRDIMVGQPSDAPRALVDYRPRKPAAKLAPLPVGISKTRVKKITKGSIFDSAETNDKLEKHDKKQDANEASLQLIESTNGDQGQDTSKLRPPPVMKPKVVIATRGITGKKPSRLAKLD